MLSSPIYKASRVGKVITPGRGQRSTASSQEATGQLWTLLPTSVPGTSASAVFLHSENWILVHPCHPNSLWIPKNIASQIQVKLCMYLQKNLVPLNQHFLNILQENPSPAQYSWEWWILSQLYAAWAHIHICVIHLWLSWLTSNSFLYPSSSRCICTLTNHFLFKSIGLEKCFSICRNSYTHHSINLPNCLCRVTLQNSTFSKRHMRN